MAVLKPTKRSSIFQRKKNRIAPINSLPNELLQQVLARVAATSFSDIYNAKLSCKAFLGAAEDDFIFEHISMDKFPRNSWDPSNKVFSFLKRCLQSGNAEALYRKGMMDYFSDLQIESGRECLKRAAQKGHMEAKYVYGIILLCSGVKSREEGLNILSCFKRYRKIETCRQKIMRNSIWRMWIRNQIIRKNDSFCHSKTCQGKQKVQTFLRERRTGWPVSDDNEGEVEYNTCCKACIWEDEAVQFCDIVQRQKI